MLVCPHYTELCRKYFKNYFCNWPTLNKFDQLMLSSSKKTLGNLGKLIYFAFRKRNSSRIISSHMYLLVIYVTQFILPLMSCTIASQLNVALLTLTHVFVMAKSIVLCLMPIKCIVLYCIYPAIRQGVCPSRMASNN